jgi:hypothetical protein
MNPFVARRNSNRAIEQFGLEDAFEPSCVLQKHGKTQTEKNYCAGLAVGNRPYSQF